MNVFLTMDQIRAMNGSEFAAHIKQSDLSASETLDTLIYLAAYAPMGMSCALEMVETARTEDSKRFVVGTDADLSSETNTTVTVVDTLDGTTVWLGSFSAGDSSDERRCMTRAGNVAAAMNRAPLVRP